LLLSRRTTGATNSEETRLSRIIKLSRTRFDERHSQSAAKGLCWGPELGLDREQLVSEFYDKSDKGLEDVLHVEYYDMVKDVDQLKNLAKSEDPAKLRQLRAALHRMATAQEHPATPAASRRELERAWVHPARLQHALICAV